MLEDKHLIWFHFLVFYLQWTYYYQSSAYKPNTNSRSATVLKIGAFTLYVGQNLFTTSCLLSSTVLWSNKLMIKKNDAVAVGPYDTCSMSVFIIAVRTFATGHMCDVNFTQPYSVGATYSEPYNENCKHFCQSYVSALMCVCVCAFDWWRKWKKNRKNYIIFFVSEQLLHARVRFGSRKKVVTPSFASHRLLYDISRWPSYTVS